MQFKQIFFLIYRIFFAFFLICLCSASLTALANANTLPSKVQLGMNNVAVMDQGWEWGDCVAFAIIAALNASHHLQGDAQISAVCWMQMNRSFFDKIDQSAWNDGDALATLLMLNHFGAMSVYDQYYLKVEGQPICGGISKYPFTPGKSEFKYSPPVDIHNIAAYIKLQKIQRIEDGGAGTEMSVQNYTNNSRYLIKNNDWYLLPHKIEKNPQQALSDIKTALFNGDRLILGIKLDIALEDHGKNLGALGKYHSPAGDTWILTPQIIKDIQDKMDFSQHAIIITGYDDDAIVSGQKGLLTVRNSVGENMGDHGDFYISYDYFLKMMLPGFPVAIKSN